MATERVHITDFLNWEKVQAKVKRGKAYCVSATGNEGSTFARSYQMAALHITRKVCLIPDLTDPLAAMKQEQTKEGGGGGKTKVVYGYDNPPPIPCRESSLRVGGHPLPLIPCQSPSWRGYFEGWRFEKDARVFSCRLSLQVS